MNPSKDRAPCLTFAIEGNIGAGKSTLLAEVPRLLAPLACACVPEPVDQWRRTGILGRFYSDPHRWGYAFQSYAFLSRLKAHTLAPRAPVTVLERSVWSDRHIFAAECVASGLFSDVERVIYEDWHDWLVRDGAPDRVRLDGIFYLASTPQVCLERIARRARTEETSAIELSYLEALHARHEAWLSATATPVCRIHADTLDWASEAAVAALGAQMRAFVGSYGIAADAAGELEVLGEDGDAPGVDGA